MFKPYPKLDSALDSGTYVMKGDPSMALLSTYHLILAGTHACNLRCRHCYLPDHDAEVLAESTAFSLVNQWSQIVANECPGKSGIFHIKGGEPFVIPYISGLMNEVLSTGNLHLMFTTNGTLGTPELSHRLAGYNCAAGGELTVIVSLDGAFRASHELLRGRNQFQKTIDFISDIIQRGIRVFLNCVLHSDNFLEVRDYLDLAVRLGVKQVNFLPLVPKGFGESIASRKLDHVKLHAHLESIYESSNQSVRGLMNGSLSHLIDEAQRGTVPAHECTAGYRGLFYIAPEGDAFTCPNITNPAFSIGNVYRDTLTDIMSRLPQLRSRLRTRKYELGDKFICTGERLLYEGRRDEGGLENLVQLQEYCEGQMRRSNPHTVTERAYCVSRNF